MKSIGVFAVIGLLSSCALLPTSESQLVDKNRIKEACSDQSIDVVLSKLTPNLYSCYGGGSYKTISTQFGTYDRYFPYRIEERNGEGGAKVFNIINEHKYYGFRLEIEPTQDPSCPTKITSHTMNFMWDRNVTHIMKWLDDTGIACIEH